MLYFQQPSRLALVYHSTEAGDQMEQVHIETRWIAQFLFFVQMYFKKHKLDVPLELLHYILDFMV
jgi:hypothetical protein